MPGTYANDVSFNLTFWNSEIQALVLIKCLGANILEKISHQALEIEPNVQHEILPMVFFSNFLTVLSVPNGSQ